MYRFVSKISNSGTWRIDSDGFLRVTMCVLCGGVFDYAKADLPEELTRLKPDLDVWRVRIPDNAFSGDFLKSAEGKPVIAWNHEWQEAAQLDKEAIIGALAGAAKMEGTEMVMDAIISDKGSIEAVKNGDLQDISAGYHSSIDPLDGDPEADAVQMPTEMNHVVLLPVGRGRCGRSVRILNKKENVMVKVKIKNAAGEEKEYQFSNEDDAKQAEGMAKDKSDADVAGVKQEGEVQMQAKNHELADAQAKFAQITAALQSLEAEKVLLEQSIKQYQSEEFQESQSKEREAYKADEQAVVENGCDEDGKKELSGKLQNAKTISERRKIVTAHICNAKGIAFDENNDKLLFGVLVKTLNKKIATEVRKPIASVRVNNSEAPVHPVFAR
jgi:hypothetical protein